VKDAARVSSKHEAPALVGVSSPEVGSIVIVTSSSNILGESK